MKRLIRMATATVIAAAMVLAATGTPASAHNSATPSRYGAGYGGVVDSPSAGQHRVVGANWTNCASAGFVRTYYMYADYVWSGYTGAVTDNTCNNGYTYTPILSQPVEWYQVCELRRTDGSVIGCTRWFNP